jgi:hypothetical protein
MAVSVTYREIAERFGIGVEGARLKAKRRAAKGLWRIVPGNHPQDVVRIEVPEDEWASSNVLRPTDPNVGTPSTSPTTLPLQDPQRRETNDLEPLVELIAKLHTQLAAMTDRLVDAERGRAEAEKDAAIVRDRLTAAEARLTTMQEQHLAELQTLRDRMEAEIAKARGELSDWKARPWWRRLAGS